VLDGQVVLRDGSLVFSSGGSVAATTARELGSGEARARAICTLSPREKTPRRLRAKFMPKTPVTNLRRRGVGTGAARGRRRHVRGKNIVAMSAKQTLTRL
jgi:hypothetical protein